MNKRIIPLFLSVTLLLSVFTGCSWSKDNEDKKTAEKFVQTLFNCPNETIMTGFTKWIESVEGLVKDEKNDEGNENALTSALAEVFGDMVKEEDIPLKLVSAGNVLSLNKMATDNNVAFKVGDMTTEKQESPENTYFVTADVVVTSDKGDGEDVTVEVTASVRFKDSKIDYFRVDADELYNLYEIDNTKK